MRRSLIGLAVIALVTMAACSGTAATAAPSAAPATAAPTAAPTAPPTAAPASAAPASPAASSAGGAAQNVAIKNFTFNPATVTTTVGGKVTWLNGDDTAHTVTFDDASVASSGNLNPAQSFDGTFSKAGTFPYHCKIHPSMTGTVTVS